MVKGMYGVSILVDEINAILGESLNSYLKEQTFRILGEPLPVEKENNSIDWKTQKGFDFEYKIGFVESINLALDNKTKGVKYAIKVDDKLINETIDNLKSQYGNSTNPEVSEANDTIYGDLKAAEGEFEKNTFSSSFQAFQKVFGQIHWPKQRCCGRIRSKRCQKG
ncbi:trigger factor family protein [Algoriphagus boritolerans]|uniref:trigger factor family protein n=1 Tax=Algoriphagus boritolerans TaxID=308111 RepID=UPI000A77D967